LHNRHSGRERHLLGVTGQREPRVPEDVPQLAGWSKGVTRLGVPENIKAVAKEHPVRGVTQVKTWEEFRDVATFFQRPEAKRYGCAMPSDRAYDGLTMGVQNLLWAFGGKWHADDSMRVNVRSLYLFTQAVKPHMQRNGGGSIINISSGAAAHEVSALMPPGYVIYSVAKAALERFSSAVATRRRSRTRSSAT
jgi:hypothetical protein